MNKLKIIIIVTILTISFFIYQKESSKTKYDLLIENIVVDSIKENNTTPKNISSKEMNKIKVHVIGEINNPGLYELDENSRINDLILASGNTTENADLSKVNLAYKLSDGDKIYIPSIFDEDSEYIYNEAGDNVLIESNSNSSSRKININKATVSDFEKISGIGSSLANKIISYRNSNGNFNSIEELKNVSGIGEKKFEMIKDYITV